MIHSQIIPFASPLFDSAVRLRKKVLRDPLKLEFHIDDIEKEWDQIHVGLLNTRLELIGVATIVPLELGKAKVRQVAIHPALQRKGYGEQLNKHVERIARNLGIQEIILHARATAVPFYEKNDFIKLDEQVFEEVGIPHYKMHKYLNN